MSEDLAVVCIQVGNKYTDDYVIKLRNMVRRNLSTPHDFLCFTDRKKIPGIHCYPPLNALPGWWQKPSLFNLRGYLRFFYLDLDSVVIGSLDPFLNVDHPFCAATCLNLREHVKGGIESTLMVWDEGFGEEILENFPLNHPPKGFHGDQNWIAATMSTVWRYPREWVISYKWDFKKGKATQETKVLSFHGKPNPHEINTPIVKENWR